MSYPVAIQGPTSPTTIFNNVPTIIIGAPSGAAAVTVPLQARFDGTNLQYTACVNFVSAGNFVLNMQQVLANQVLQLISTGFGSPTISSSDGSLIDGENSLQLKPGSVIGIRWNATDSQWETAS